MTRTFDITALHQGKGIGTTGRDRPADEFLRAATLHVVFTRGDARKEKQHAGEVAGRVAINEVVVHGWDIAAATRHDYTCETGLIQAAYAFVQSAVAQDPDGSPGLFGPPVPVPESAPPLDRLIGLTGRDPAWQPEN
jgi:uncharacterized protein (TIGR03086 family)